jgi:hypothetical protein
VLDIAESVDTSFTQAGSGGMVSKPNLASTCVALIYIYVEKRILR